MGVENKPIMTVTVDVYKCFLVHLNNLICKSSIILLEITCVYIYVIRCHIIKHCDGDR